MKTSSQVTRRQFAAGSAAALAGFAFLRSPARAAEFAWKYGHNLPVEHPLHVRMTQMWKAVREETHGRLSVETFPHSTLGGDSGMMSQLRSGALQFHTQTGGVLAALVPAASAEQLPFVFPNEETLYKAMDGQLGGVIRKQIEERNIIVFPKVWDLGFRQITSSLRPIHSAEDLAGFKIRTPPSRIWVDAFKALGASPTPIDFNEVYISLQTHLVDGAEGPYSIIEVSRFYEVQKYLSVTNHMWAGYWMLSNQDAWKSLPRDIQDVVMRNAEKYALLQRRDVALLNASVADKLHRQGLAFNITETGSFRKKLGGFYKDWKGILGDAAWTALEKYTGPLA